MTDTPTVKLAGREWPVPELAVRQLRVVRRPLLDLTDSLNAFGSKKAGEWLMKLSPEQYDQLTEVVYQGLNRGTPSFKREEFLELPVNDLDLFTGFLVVRRQSGLFKAVNDDDLEKKTDAEAGSPQDQTQIGTASS